MEIYAHRPDYHAGCASAAGTCFVLNDLQRLCQSTHCIDNGIVKEVKYRWFASIVLFMRERVMESRRLCEVGFGEGFDHMAPLRAF